MVSSHTKCDLLAHCAQSSFFVQKKITMKTFFSIEYFDFLVIFPSLFVRMDFSLWSRLGHRKDNKETPSNKVCTFLSFFLCFTATKSHFPLPAQDASVESSLVKNNINLVTAEPTTDTLKQSFDTRKLTPTVQPVLPTRRSSGQAAENEKDLSSSSNDGFRLSVLVPCQDPDTGFTKKCLLVKKTL